MARRGAISDFPSTYFLTADVAKVSPVASP